MTIELDEAKLFCKNHSRSLLTCNIQSYNKNHFHIKNLIDEVKPTFVSLQEIWNPKISMSINGYHDPIVHLRNQKRGGGCSIYVDSSLTYEVYEPITNMSSDSLEKIAVKIIDNKCKTFLLISIYRAPSKNFKESISDLKKLFEIATATKLPFILTGDLNIDLLRFDNFSNEYLDVLNTFELNQHMQDYSRVCSTKKSLLDHVISTSDLLPIKAHSIHFPVADHLPNLTLWHESKEEAVVSNLEFSQRINYKKLETLVKNSEIPNGIYDDASGFENLHDSILKCINESTYSLPKRERPKNPWISKDTILFGMKVRRLHRKFIRKNSSENQVEYRDAKRIYQKMIRNDKNNYYRTQFDLHKNNAKKTWSLINECLNRNSNKNDSPKISEKMIFNGTPSDNEAEIAAKLNLFYKNIALEITERIDEPINSPDFYLQKAKSPYEPLTLTECTNEEVRMIVMSLASKPSTGPDMISNKILKKILPYILNALTSCINYSIREAEFPQILKTSKLTPIYKALKTDRSNPDNWRPIAELSPFSKVYEKVVMNQLTEQFDRQEIINPYQFGFRKGHSTVHPLMITRNFIEKELKNQNYVCLITIDLKKAFDCIRTNGELQNKIKYYSKNDQITNWFNSYFKDRMQFTNWGNASSDIVKNHPISIIQGSKNGPKLFNLMINELPKITNLTSALYADDANFICSNKNPEALCSQVNKELITIKDFFNANGLALSISKSTFMIFRPKNKKKFNFNIKIGSDDLTESEELTFLGVIIDNKLNFSSHFKKVYAKMKKGLNGLIMVKNQLSYRAKLNVYHGLIHSHLNYCSLIWLSNISKNSSIC